MNIMGKSECTAAQMAAYLIAKNQDSKSWALEYANIYLEEGDSEGVRGDIAWIQSCKETGNFMFIPSRTAVTFDQNNFCGMGVTQYGLKGNSFSTPRLGIRAQIQHLKAYASSCPLRNQCVDPRYHLVEKGCATTVEQLAGHWAVPGYDTSKASSLQDAMEKKIGYGFDIINGVNSMKSIVVKEEKKYYRVQCGAFTNKTNAEAMKKNLESAGFDTIIKQNDGMYKCQVGAFSNKANAEMYLENIKSKGFDAFVIYN